VHRNLLIYKSLPDSLCITDWSDRTFRRETTTVDERGISQTYLFNGVRWSKGMCGRARSIVPDQALVAYELFFQHEHTVKPGSQE